MEGSNEKGKGMTEAKRYIQIMIDSLGKKSMVLSAIIEQNEEQNRIVSEEFFDAEAFDATVDEKAKLIDELNLLDNGFESVYDRVRTELLENKDMFQSEIKTLQALVGEVTEKSVSIQTEEERNRKLVLSKLSVERKKLRETKVNSKIVNNYYNNMKQINNVDAQFLDKKK